MNSETKNSNDNLPNIKEIGSNLVDNFVKFFSEAVGSISSNKEKAKNSKKSIQKIKFENIEIIGKYVNENEVVKNILIRNNDLETEVEHWKSLTKKLENQLSIICDDNGKFAAMFDVVKKENTILKEGIEKLKIELISKQKSEEKIRVEFQQFKENESSQNLVKIEKLQNQIEEMSNKMNDQTFQLKSNRAIIEDQNASINLFKKSLRSLINKNEIHVEENLIKNNKEIQTEMTGIYHAKGSSIIHKQEKSVSRASLNQEPIFKSILEVQNVNEIENLKYIIDEKNKEMNTLYEKLSEQNKINYKNLNELSRIENELKISESKIIKLTMENLELTERRGKSKNEIDLLIGKLKRLPKSLEELYKLNSDCINSFNSVIVDSIKLDFIDELKIIKQSLDFIYKDLVVLMFDTRQYKDFQNNKKIQIENRLNTLISKINEKMEDLKIDFLKPIKNQMNSNKRDSINHPEEFKTTKKCNY